MAIIQQTANNKPLTNQQQCRPWPMDVSELANTATFIKNVISSENSVARKWKSSLGSQNMFQNRIYENLDTLWGPDIFKI